MSDNAYVKNELLETFIFFMFIILFFVGIGSILVSTIFKGFSDANFQSSFSLYLWMAIISGIIILGLAGWNYFKHKRDFIIPLHEPESAIWSQEGKTAPKFLRNPLLATITFSLLFMWLVYSKVIKQFSLDFLTFKTQAVAPFGNFWAQCVFPLIENLVIFVQFILIISWAKKKVYPKSKLLYYVLILLVVPLLLALEWVAFHNLVYQASTPDQISTFFSGFIWIMLTALTMSIIAGLVLHFMIDFFLFAFAMGWLASWIFSFVMLGVSGGLIVLFVIVYVKNKTPDKLVS